jgi:hypothetical protein
MAPPDPGRVGKPRAAAFPAVSRNNLSLVHEDLVDRNLTALSAHLGREIRPAAEIPRDDRVNAHTKSDGDWRSWFVKEDIRIFELIYKPYMDRVGYHSNDRALNPNPIIDRALASEYTHRLCSGGRSPWLRPERKRLGRICESVAVLVGRHPS